MNLWEKQKWLVIVSIILVCTGAGLWFSRPEEQSGGRLAQDVPITAGDERKEERLCVYISGAVAQPGLYRVPPGTRYGDALEQSGGLTEQADLSKVNLAKKCKDGCQIHVPERKVKREKTAKGKSGRKSTKEQAEQGNEEAAGKVNVNLASAEELERLPGIGPSLAQKIIRCRQAKRFTTVNDLLQVPGIGPAKLKRLADKVEV